MSEDLCLLRDAYWLLCRKEIGQGQNRTVYESDILPNYVFKTEKFSENFHNILEWHVWNVVKDTEMARWFAPCFGISPNGKVLAMARTRPALDADYPEQIPAFFLDVKKSNWGIYEDRLVCHDYAVHNMMEKGMSKKMQRADWST